MNSTYKEMFEIKKEIEKIELDIIEERLKLDSLIQKKSYLLKKSQHLFR